MAAVKLLQDAGRQELRREADEMSYFEWETLTMKLEPDGSPQSPSVKRARVPGGWLVFAETASGEELIFYPDPHHEWGERTSF